MSPSEIKSKISFFQQSDLLEKIQDSNSGADVYKVIRLNECYFFKMIDYNNGDEKRIPKLFDLYAKVEPKSLFILDSGRIDSKIWFVYNWIEGISLNKLYNVPNHDFYDYGYQIGTYYNKLNSLSGLSEYKNDYDFNQLATSIRNQFYELYKSKSIFKTYFKETIETAISNFYSNEIESFFSTKKEFIHGDLHPKNVMMSKDKTLVIIDCEYSSTDYFVMNFRWSLASIYKEQDNLKFFKGFIDGRYPLKRPEGLEKQMIFMLIFKFYEQTVFYDKQNQMDLLKEYLIEFNNIFSSILKQNHFIF